MGVTIDRVDRIGVDDFQREYARKSRPVVISGCIEHWPARRKWSLDYFATRYRDKQVRFSGKQWTIGEFAETLRAGVTPTPYLNQVKLDEQFPELYEDIGDLAYTRRNELNNPLLPRSMRIPRGIKAVFIGGAGSGFGKLHWDTSYTHVYISQVHGPKDFLLYAPSDSAYLYPRPNDASVSQIVDINNVDLAAYPDLNNATPIRFTVAEGETVFIPGGWWHATKMHELSISLAESSLDRGNWQKRYDWYMDEYRLLGVPAAKRAALSVYTRALGLFIR